MTDQAHYVLTLPLADEQESLFRSKLPYLADAIHAIATPADATLPVVAHAAFVGDVMVSVAKGAASLVHPSSDARGADLVFQADAQAAIAAARAEIARLREALEPFAEQASYFDAAGNDYQRDYEDSHGLGSEDEEDVMNCLKVGHLRRAEAVLAGAAS